MAYQNRNAPITMDGERLNALRTLLANLFIDPYQEAGGMVSRMAEMGSHKIDAKMLSNELGWEQAVIRALTTARNNNVVATPENVLPTLSVNFPDAKVRLDALLGYRTDGADVYSVALALGDWMDNQRLIMDLMQVVRTGSEQYMLPEELYVMAAKVIAKAAPASKQVSSKTDIEAIDAWHQNRLETAISLRSGKPLGPNFPWPDFNDHVPALKLGWLATFFAKPGHGKSTLALILAMWWAYTQGYDVLFLHLETDIVDMMDRYIAAEMVIPADSWDKGKAYIDQEPFATKYQEAKAKIEDYVLNKGTITYKHVPGATCDDIESWVAEHKVASEVRGRELIVVVDYYSKIGGQQIGQSSTAHHNAVADRLKNIAEAEQTKCYMVALAQFDADTAYEERTKSADGSHIYNNSQLYVRIERDVAQNDDPVRVDGKIKKDILGNDMYYHRALDASSNASLNIIKCNQGRTGPVLVKFWNGYFRITARSKSSVKSPTPPPTSTSL